MLTMRCVEPLSICFVHPDLGLGGAEMLVVETATALKKAGHHVEVFTSYHDPQRAFTETIDGTLDVHVHDSIIPRSIFGIFLNPMATIRFFWTTAKVMMRHKNLAGGYDIIFVDQISSTIPLLKYSGSKVVYYCHFPDLLLSSRGSWIKRLYRLPIDFLEEITTAQADVILVNSQFTLNIFHNTFKSIKRSPTVLYPTVHVERISLSSSNRGSQTPSSSPASSASNTPKASGLSGSKGAAVIPERFQELAGTKFVLSLNRFERKKNHGLAIDAFAIILEKMDAKEKEKLRLVIAGGYDERVLENVEHLKELQQHAHQAGVSDYVSFFTKLPDRERNWLLWNCKVVLYTPENEHFGIVPLEAGAALRPVIACNSGGPLESILDGVTGYHCPSDPAAWAEKMLLLLRNEPMAKQFGESAVKRVVNNFSPNIIIPQLENILYDLNLRKRH